MEGRSSSRLGFNPNPAMVVFHDPFTDSQANAGSGVFNTGVETLEETKNILPKFLSNAKAVVSYGENPCCFPVLGRDMDKWGPFRVAILNRVTDKILHHLSKMNAIHGDLW